MPPEVSIITVCYNTPEDLLTLYHSMEDSLSADQYEWIVVDNGSRQDLSSQLRDAVYLRMEDNLGFGTANNVAVGRATAPYLFFVNPDCEFIEDCVTPLKIALKDAAIAGPCVLNQDGTIQLSFGPSLSILREMRQKILISRERSKTVQSWLRKKTQTLFHPDYVSGCALMIRADLFRKLRGFDENFFLYHEDVDLCKRVWDQGLSVVYVPSARIVHAKNRSIHQERNRVNVEYRKSQLHYYRKHRGRLENLILKFYLSIKFILKYEMLRLIWGKPQRHESTERRD